MYITDTALRNSQGILPLDTIKNWLLTNISLFMASLLEWDVKVKQICLIWITSTYWSKSGINQMNELEREWPCTCQDSGPG